MNVQRRIRPVSGITVADLKEAMAGWSDADEILFLADDLTSAAPVSLVAAYRRMERITVDGGGNFATYRTNTQALNEEGPP